MTKPRKTRREPWTHHRDTELVAMRSKGWTFAQIAEQFRISRNAAIGRFHRVQQGVEARGA